MEKGFVYVARLIDYNGNFVGNFYKVGKSLQYKVRETQLNPTHLPLDVLLIRVFETDHMSMLENILHTTLVDYRIEKKYNDRRNITTEWFDLEDDEDFHYRIDEIVKNFPNVQEVNIVNKISGDTQTNSTDKKEFIEAIRKERTTLKFFLNGEDLTQETSADTFSLVMAKIGTLVGWENFMKQTVLVRADKEEIKKRFPKSFRESSVRFMEGHYIWPGFGNADKLKILKEHIENNNIEGFELFLQTK